MIVVDTNILVALFFKTLDYEFVAKVLEFDSDWAVPYLWRSEFRNVLSGYVRKELISFPTAILIMEKAENLMQGREYRVSSDQVLVLAQQAHCSVYDCEFVALAENLSSILVTRDHGILKSFPEIALSPEKYIQIRETHD